jgi:hypothetical protein
MISIKIFSGESQQIRLLIRGLALVLLFTSVCGCGLFPRQSAPVRAYVDTSRLLSLHPGIQALKQLDSEFKATADLAGVKEQLQPILPPAPIALPAAMAASGGPLTPPAAEQARSFLSRAQAAAATHLELLGQELADTRNRKVAQRRKDMLPALEQEMKTEQARLHEPQRQEEQQVFEQYRVALFNLQVNLKRKNLSEKERTSLQNELKEIEAKQDAAVAAVRNKYKEMLANLRAERTQKLEQVLANYEAQLKSEDEAILAEHRAKMQVEFSAAATSLQGSMKENKVAVGALPPAPQINNLARQLKQQHAQAEAVVSGSQKALLEKLTNLRDARARLWAALQDEVKSALEEAGADHGVEFVFDRAKAKKSPDYTDKAAEWLKDYWKAPDS